jgi:hypothetical protein
MSLLTQFVEPALLRECEQRFGAASSGFSHALITCVEVVPVG